MIFGRDRDTAGKTGTAATNSAMEVDEIITDALSSDTAVLVKEAGPIGRAFIQGVDKAVHLQSGQIRAYVNWLRRQNPEASPAAVQEILDKHFRNAVTGTGAGAGAAAAIPGIGLITGSAAVAGESLLFLDLAAFYTVASASLRGVEVSDPERRRAIVLVALTGSKGLAVVDTLLGDNARKVPTVSSLSRFSGPTLTEANSILTRVALKSVRKRFGRAWLGKLLPLGLGAIAGIGANRKLAAAIIDNVAPSLGPIPGEFPQPVPPPKSLPGGSSFIDFVNSAFGRSSRSSRNSRSSKESAED